MSFGLLFTASKVNPSSTNCKSVLVGYKKNVPTLPSPYKLIIPLLTKLTGTLFPTVWPFICQVPPLPAAFIKYADLLVHKSIVPVLPL